MLRIENLHVTYRARGGAARAVTGVSLSVARGETLGLVGESGCGKSTLARTVMRLVEPSSGSIHIDDIEVTALSGRALAPHRHRVQMVFQDPASSLDPRFTVTRLIAEPLTLTIGEPAARNARVAALMDQVGLARSLKDRFPHELSGGQRQRVAIARAIAPKPGLVVLDEPVSALDVSLQAQVLNLLVDLQEAEGLAYLFVSHDIGVVQHMADRIAAMYLGRIVEIGNHADVVDEPAHPYTQALMRAVPIADPRRHRIADKQVLAGDVPSPTNSPAGCAFHPRCAFVMDRCRREVPVLRGIGLGREVACHLHDRGPAPTVPASIRQGQICA